MKEFQLRNQKPKSITIFQRTRLTYLTKSLKSLLSKNEPIWTDSSEIKCIYERLDPLLPAMPLTDASSALFVLMIFPCNMISDWEKNITARKAGGWPPCAHWPTCVTITPKAARQRGEWLGSDSWSHIPRRVLFVRSSTDSPTADLQVWKPRAEYEDSTSRYENSDATQDLPLVVQWLRVRVLDSGPRFDPRSEN